MKIKYSVLVLSAFLTVNSYANPCISMMGAYLCQNGTVTDISGEFAGLMIEHMNVTGIITGTHAGIDIENSTINQIKVESAGLNIKDSTVRGNINGSIAGLILESSNTKDINIRNKEIYASQSNIKKLSISSNESPKITLVENSAVLENIIFKQTQGILCLDETSKVHGRVINGQIKNSNCE